MKIKTFVIGPIQTSCYVAYKNEGDGAIIIDAGGDPAEIISFLKQHNLTPSFLVNTHGHIDHIMGNPGLKEEFPDMQICIHPADAKMLSETKSNLASELGFEFTSPQPDKLLQEGDTLSLTDNPDEHFRIIHLPGHTKGGIGLLYAPQKGSHSLFSGDALFARSIGRTDFPGGSLKELVSNIKKKILTLPGDTVVYPGHGPSTTVGDEKHSNPFLCD